MARIDTNEINLMKKYPKTLRNPNARGVSKTEQDIAVARYFGKEFFDGDRSHGYGGFKYDAKFWSPVVPDFINYFNFADGDSILDVGCAKGFMLHDFKQVMPGLILKGIDISSYAISNCIESVRNDCLVGNATNLPFEDNSFDVVISITTIHNLEGDDLIKALSEIERVAKRGSFITVDAYRDETEKEAMLAWNLTAKTILHVDDWKDLFAKVGFTGNYFWFIP